jgi:hypothetical protein
VRETRGPNAPVWGGKLKPADVVRAALEGFSIIDPAAARARTTPTTTPTLLRQRKTPETAPKAGRTGEAGGWQTVERMPVDDPLNILENDLRDLIALVLAHEFGEDWVERTGVTDERLQSWTREDSLR